MIAGEGQAFPGALVALQRDADKRIWSTQTSDDGGFKIEGLPPGLYQFVACAPGMDPDMGWLLLKKGEPEMLELIVRYGV